MLAGRSPFDIVGATDNPDQNTEDYLFQVILEKTIRIPRSISTKAQSALKGFLNKNPAERLGCHPETGIFDIQTHPFFKSIDWKSVILLFILVVHFFNNRILKRFCFSSKENKYNLRTNPS